MGFLRRILGKHRRHDRLDIKLSVRVETEAGNGKEFWTEDVSESGLRMDISPLSGSSSTIQTPFPAMVSS